MATYEYRCAEHGAFDEVMPLGTAPASVACASCGGSAARVFTVPYLRGGNPGARAAIEHAEKSRWEPEVVRTIPSEGARRPARMAPNDPRLLGLPRP